EDIIRLTAQCKLISKYGIGNLIFSPIALALIIIFSWSIKRETRCRTTCNGQPEPCEESKFSQYYVTELFRRNIRSHTRVTTFDKQDIHPDDLIDYKHVVELQNQGK
ncbi:unnamed protein product, partial [Rotaria sp. Silwood1]